MFRTDPFLEENPTEWYVFQKIQLKRQMLWIKVKFCNFMECEKIRARKLIEENRQRWNNTYFYQ